MRKIYFIDLFCGAGGTSTGVHKARYNGFPFAEVLACVNHDPMAIASHKANHPCTLHYTEDIRTLNLHHITNMVKYKRMIEPDCLIILWASLECTQFSRAKGGQARNADSRTLAEHIPRYIEAFNPDGAWFENVEEFMSWGPLDENGKPVSKKSGRDYMRWVQYIKSYGYDYDFRILNSADYGAFTSRKRYFAQFNNPGVPTVWPSATHSKSPGNDMFTILQPWNAVKHCLDFSNEGKSIFGRKTQLSEKTLERIYAGLIKYVAGGKDAYLMKYYSGKPENKCTSIESPSATLRTKDTLSLVNAEYLMKYHGKGQNINGLDGPASTLSTKDRLAKVKPVFVTPEYFIDKTYGGDANHQSVEQPAGTIMPNDKHQLVNLKYCFKPYKKTDRNTGPWPFYELEESKINNRKWIMNTNFNNVGSSIDEPAHTITANRKWHYLMNPQWGGNPGDVEKPSFTLIARMDKAPPYLISTESGHLAIEVYETDSPAMVQIKAFMAMYGIIDIKMRMLVVDELLKIQGFPEDYVLLGTQADKKKFIGNSVVPHVVTAMCEAMYVELLNRVAA